MRTHHCPTACECFLSGLFPRKSLERFYIKETFGEVAPVLAIFMDISTGIHFAGIFPVDVGTRVGLGNAFHWRMAMMCCVFIYIYTLVIVRWYCKEYIYRKNICILCIYNIYIYLQYIYSPRVVSNHHPWLRYGAWVDKVFKFSFPFQLSKFDLWHSCEKKSMYSDFLPLYRL